MGHYYGYGYTMSDEEYNQYLEDIKKDPNKAIEYKKRIAEQSQNPAINNISEGGNWLKEKASQIWNGLTGQTSAKATLEANKMNIENQNYWNQIAMQREDTAHQREVADLQAAGLNPWLSAGGGAPASALSTAEAQPVDGSKILQATSAMALLAVSKMISSIAARQRTIYRR